MSEDARAAMALKRAVMLALTFTAGAAGCWPTFPDELLRPPRDAARDSNADAVSDLGRSDVPDAGVTDAGMDSGVPDTGVADAGDDAGATDAGDDGGDGGAMKPDGDGCEMAPTSAVPGMRVTDGLSSARDFTFDGSGAVLVGIANAVVRVQGSSRETLVTSDQGDIAFLRYTRRSGLVVAVNRSDDGGTPTAGVYVLRPGETTLTPRATTLTRVGGLAVAPDDTVWFTDTPASRLYRLDLTTMADPVVMAVTTTGTPPVALASMSHLAFNESGTRLYIARENVPSVYEVDLTASDGGAMLSSRLCSSGLFGVSGLATDACGNVYIADVFSADSSRIYRVAGSCDGTSARFSEPTTALRGLAFGPGGMFGPRELYTLRAADGAMLGHAAVVRGVPNPVPTP